MSTSLYIFVGTVIVPKTSHIYLTFWQVVVTKNVQSSLSCKTNDFGTIPRKTDRGVGFDQFPSTWQTLKTVQKLINALS